MKKRFTHYIGNVFITGLAATVLLLFLWRYSETGTPPTVPTATQDENTLDFYLVNATSKQFDKQGTLETVLYADTIDHYPYKDHAILKQPDIRFYKNGLLTWTVTADSGIVHGQGEQIDFSQRVIVINKDQQMTLKTPFLTVYPDDKIATSKKPVTLINPKGFTRAIGMKAYLDKQYVTLLEQVRGQYHVTP